MKNLVILIILLISQIYGFCQTEQKIPFWDHSMTFEKRAEDLVSRLSLDEKVQQLMNHAPAIERFGIPAYDWWNEVLHGVARTPFHTTSFPQAIGMAATWDTASLKLMAHYAALEGRAVHNRAIALGRTGERYMGLTYWTPNINIFRDPRWGRGQETYGEDPFLTGKLGAAFVRGLQGDDPKYLKAAACAKHFAVHSGPEPTRHSDNIYPSAYDLWDTYLPAFKELVTKANVEGVMCAYNAFRGQPCCASDELMQQILRQQWGFEGYVTSDCWALNDFFTYHKTHPDKIHTAVDALVHTTDVECGKDIFLSLSEAVRSGLVPESQIDSALYRLFMTRLKLGMFDPKEIVPYAMIPDEVIESPAHRDHAVKMASQSIVLLKNDHNTLPLSKNLNKIVVFGPNGDNRISILGNYNGTPSDPISVVNGMRRKLKETEVIFEQAVNFTNDTLLVSDEFSSWLDMNGFHGFKIDFYNDRNLSGDIVQSMYVRNINFFWTDGQSPAKEVNSNYFSARMTSFLKTNADQPFYFNIEADDGYRIWINDSLYVNAWERNPGGAQQFSFVARANSTNKIVIEYYQTEGNAMIRFMSGHYQKTDFDAIIQQYADADAFIFAGGISPQLEGEEMTVHSPGFTGGDRTTIALPEIQSSFLSKLTKSGKPVVFVMMTGSALAIPEEDKTVPAIINAWYGGQAAGTAIADVLFGDYNPAGRLPLTFYKSDKDLPDFKDYSMSNRTYRYFKGVPLYPFGYGLSYTTFEYKNLKVSGRVTKGNDVTIQAMVKNTGNFDGEEVVQCYISHKNGTFLKPIRALKGFRRIFLKAGESQLITFVLTPEDLSIVSDKGELFQPEGEITVSVGGGQPDIPGKTSSNVLTTRISVNR
ncbi:MAG TPA: glycosyl hydrolase [Saprospirales bacterium]|nr:glycosyl hydrolase [Saprospirales bacterium]HRQ28524.1 glycoside hydrolase family 3 C-terminal domain-containing protein [Saprospiraceae bacterium]